MTFSLRKKKPCVSFLLSLTNPVPRGGVRRAGGREEGRRERGRRERGRRERGRREKKREVEEIGRAHV